MNRLISSTGSASQAKSLAVLAMVFSACLFGCGDDIIHGDSGLDGGAIDATPDRVIDGRCDPMITLDHPTHITARSVYALRPTGGTGAYRFSFIENASGANLQERGGDYLAGATTGVTDIIMVSDDGCEGTLEHAISVLMPLDVQPQEARIPLMSSLTMSVSGGSGEFQFDMILAGSGGSIDMETGTYMAGGVEGRDVIEVTDLNTGESSQANFDVLEDGGVTLTAGHLSLPLGSSGRAPAASGSGAYELSASAPGILTFDGDLITGVSPGSVTMTIRDRFTGDSLDMPVTIMAPALTPLSRQGDAYEEREILAAGDLNGDGFPDAVVGMPEADIGGNNSGAVFVYAGNGVGFDATPVQTLHTHRRNARFGTGVQIADLNGDGEIDLVVSSPTVDMVDEERVWYSSGGVYVYRGVAGGFFADSPSDVMRGYWSYDQAGWQIAVCDFNGDGRLDIAAGSTEAEERTDTGTVIGPNTRGSVQLYFGSPGGFSTTPNQMIYGQGFMSSGVFQPIAGLRLGRQIAPGDFNGDGVCDLAATAQSPHREFGRNNDGAVFLYRGTRASGADPGGLEGLPYRAVVGRMPNPLSVSANTSGWFGIELQTADVNDDGRDDLLVGHPYWDDVDRVPSAWNDRGAIYLFLGSEDGGSLGTSYEVAHDSADALLYGHEAGAYWGRSIGVGDLDGDGSLELLVGAPAAEQSPNPSSSGEVHRVDIVDTGGVLSLVPSDWAGYDVSSGRFGQSISITPNPDGSPGGDLLALARYDWTEGDYVGAILHTPYTPSEDPMVPAFSPSIRLEYPGEPAGAGLGQSVDIVGDITRNGYPDLLVGAMTLGTRGSSNTGLGWGAAFLYEGRSDGFDLNTPVFEIQNQNGQHSNASLGSQLTAAGDFNGDGHPDFAVVGMNIDRTGNARGVTRGPSAACGTNRGSNPGGTFIYLSQPGVDHGLSQPAFVYYGPSNNFQASDIIGAFDANGDGYDDLLLAAYFSDLGGTDTGAVVFIPGRPADSDPTSTQEICADAPGTPASATTVTVVQGLYSYSYYGKGVTSLGDLNRDGCDEVAIGVEQYGTETALGSRRGAVDVIFGWSNDAASTCPRERRTLRLVCSLRSSRAGAAVSGGADVDGDGLSELLVTGRSANSSVGRSWVIRGSYLLANMPTTPLEIQAMEEPGQEALQVDGTEANVDYGWSAAFVPNLAGDEGFGIAIGVRLAGATDDSRRRGTVLVHRLVSRDGGYAIEAQPYLLFPGESSTYDPRFGERIRVGPYGAASGNRHAILISSPYSQSVGAGWGTAWVHPLGR